MNCFAAGLAIALFVMGGSAVRSATAPVAVNPLQPFETQAAQALLIDADTQTILFEKAFADRIAPASLGKLMTLAVVFSQLKAGRLKLDDTFKVSENAWRKGGAPSRGTTMFAKLGSTIKVSDLIRGAIVQSANDGCIVLAEGIAGTEDAFVDLMNAEARRLGLTASHFANVTGAADAQEYTSPRDLATLAQRLIADYPEYYPIYREPSFTWNGIQQNNRNPLLAAGIGGDGLGLGGADDTGYGLVGSAARDGQRLILVLTGAPSDKVRADEAKKLLDWGFRSFERVTVFGAADVVGEAAVFGGTRPSVRVATGNGLDALLPRGGRDLVRARVVYQGPVKAPIAKGQRIGTVQLSVSERVIREAPVYAAEDIGIGSIDQRAADGLHELLFGWWR